MFFNKRKDEDHRFKVLHEQVHVATAIRIIVDTETGVQYLFYQNGAASGFTALLNKEGKPFILEDINFI